MNGAGDAAQLNLNTSSEGEWAPGTLTREILM